ncbi:hypothetical protein GCM10028793_16510 [Nocardiopsis oceani]
MPHWRQNPSVRPGCSPRDRPTFSVQLPQKRFFSDTTGLVMIASDGSLAGTSGTWTMPRPSMPRLEPRPEGPVPEGELPTTPEMLPGPDRPERRMLPELIGWECTDMSLPAESRVEGLEDSHCSGPLPEGPEGPEGPKEFWGPEPCGGMPGVPGAAWGAGPGGRGPEGPGGPCLGP